MDLHRDMDEREQMRTTILNQEHIFRQQVHELHRLYHVHKQLMQQAHTPAPATRAPAAANAMPRRPQLDIWCSETARNSQQRIISFNTATAPAPARAEDCNLELTLATGPSNSGSSSCCDGGGRRENKRLKASPNSDSGATAVSSTSTDSELARFGDMDVAATLPVARFHGEVTRRMGEVGQGPWMYRCLSLKTA